MTLLRKPLQAALFLTLMIVFAWSYANPAAAQTGVEGQVFDAEEGEPLQGATVMIEELEIGDATDATGSFAIEGIDPGTYTLTVSFVGFEDQTETVEVTSGQMTQLAVELAPEAEVLEEMVVTGYEVQPRREVTGAITRVDGEDFRVRAIQTADEALQGQSAGVQMVQTTGEPGGGFYMRIRGVGSIDAGNDPLFIIDGVPLTNDSFTGSNQGSWNPLSRLDPSDIESIEVLRDAEATAIYGAQGANGVVLVTTRSGFEGDTEVNFSAQVGQAEQKGFFPIMDSPTWTSFMAEAFENRAEVRGDDPEAARQEAFSRFGEPDEVETYDWQRILHRPARSYRTNLTVSGGGPSTQFYLSGNFSDQEGTVEGSSFRRMGIRANVDHNVTDRLQVSVNSNIARTDEEGQITGGNFINSPFHGGVSKRPTTPVWENEEEGIYNQDIPGVLYNNLQRTRLEEQRTWNTLIDGNIQATYQFSPNLRLTGLAGVDYRNIRDRRFRNPAIPRYASFGGRVYESTREVNNWNTNLRLNYNETFDEVHNVSGLVGTEYRRMWRERHFASIEEVPNQFFQTMDLAADPSSWGGSQSEYRTAGFFSRATYNFDQRYFVSANLRTDGHSRFGEDERWGVFYSGALAWDVAQEPFMDDVDWLNQLKPRVSYGITGNSDISNFASRTLYGSGGTYEGTPGLEPTQLGVADLTWEQAEDIDIGIDYTLFGGRLYGEAGVYRSDSERLLLDRFLPGDSGFNEVTENAGVVRNEGIELELGVVPIDVGDFMWRSEFNITFQDSEVLELIEDQEDITSFTSTIRVGEKRNMWRGRDYAGVNPADGRPMFRDSEGNLRYNIGSSEFQLLGSYIPDSFGGWTNTFTYGPFEMDAFFQFEFGSDVYNTTYHSFLMDPSRQRALSTELLDRWQEPGDVTHVPMAYPENSIMGATPHTFWSDFRLDDGSYVRLKNVTLSYQLPEGLMDTMNMRGASIFVQGENLLTFSEYRGPDPEIVNEQSGSYPQAREFTLGVEVGL